MEYTNVITDVSHAFITFINIQESWLTGLLEQIWKSIWQHSES